MDENTLKTTLMNKLKYDQAKKLHIDLGMESSTIPFDLARDMDRNRLRKQIIDKELEPHNRVWSLRKYIDLCIEPEHWFIKINNDLYIHAADAFQYIIDTTECIDLEAKHFLSDELFF